MPHDVDHSNDAARMAEIERYGLLSAAARPELTALADLAARVCGVSSAFISVITDTELLQLATVGFDKSTMPRAQAMCDAVLAEDEPLVRADLTRDRRFRDNPFVQSGRMTFYASYQLATPSGVPFGSLCVFDDKERDIDASQRRALRDLTDRVVDVLELELRNRELASSVAELERSNLQLAAFAGQVSHDLRNPLGAVSGTLEVLDDLLDRAEPDLEVVRGLVGKAYRSTGRMARLVDEVLQFAALGGHLEPVPVRMQGLLDHVVADLSVELADVELKVGQLIDVTADPVQLRIVVQNALSNAARYAIEGVPGFGASIEIETWTRGGTWTLHVVDHGRGVAPDRREAVFEPLVRGDTSVAGTGMGLATSRRIVEAHGGRIGLTETLGGGATLWVELPAS